MCVQHVAEHTHMSFRYQMYDIKYVTQNLSCFISTCVQWLGQGLLFQRVYIGPKIAQTLLDPFQ